MDIDQVITLDDGKEYVLLLKVMHDGEKYFLASETKNGEVTDNHEILKELTIDNEFSVETVTNEELKEILYDKFEDEFDNMEENED